MRCTERTADTRPGPSHPKQVCSLRTHIARGAHGHIPGKRVPEYAAKKSLLSVNTLDIRFFFRHTHMLDGKPVKILPTAIASLLCNFAVAQVPPDYEFISHVEDVTFHAKESGLPPPLLFGVEVTHRTFVVSIFGGRGQLTLGRMPFRQLDPNGPLY
jgi:hypothetical protein